MSQVRSIETFATRQLCVVRVTDDAGQQGIGQCAPFNADITAACVHRHVAPHALGQAVDGCGELLIDRVLRKEYKFSGSYVWRALAGVDTALWDLRGRRAGVSVCELAGGRLRPLGVYASSMRRDTTAEEEGERFRRAMDALGVRAGKVKVGGRMSLDEDAFAGRTEAVVPAVRRALGADGALLVDANGSYSVEGIRRALPLLVENDVCHLEEPCPFYDVEATAAVREMAPMDVAGGEQDFEEQQWRRLITTPAVDVVQPDAGYVGGFTRLLWIARLADRHGLACTPHSANGSMIRVFTAHALCAIPNAGPLMEFSIEGSDWARVYDPEPRVADGHLRVPEGPGWGVRVREDWLASAAREVSERA